jgi:asparaginyl-tRNA synthetase
MEWVRVSELNKHIGKKVLLKGWVYNLRSSKNIKFIILSDGSGLVQSVLFKGESPEEYFNKFDELTQETSLELVGLVKEDARSVGGVEIAVESFNIVGKSVDYPITPKEHGTPFLMENRHLWLRSKKQHAIMRVRARITKAMRDYLDDRGFVCMESPILSANSCEGTSTLFSCDYFGEKAFLTQSGQLYAEACAMAHGKVYTFGPAFRAEKSKTRRHLTEFWMLEPEMAYYDLDMNMDLIEDFVEYVVAKVVSECAEDLAVLERDVSKLASVKKPFPRISYKEASEILLKECDDFVLGGDFGAGHETILSEKYGKPIFVYDFPVAIKAFYFKRAKDPNYVRGCDLLAPEGFGEIVGGGQREDSYEELIKRINEHKLDPNEYKWFLDLRRYGSVPHSGFGIGIERTVAWICGVHHVRETIAFPRTINNLRP